MKNCLGKRQPKKQTIDTIEKLLDVHPRPWSAEIETSTNGTKWWTGKILTDDGKNFFCPDAEPEILRLLCDLVNKTKIIIYTDYDYETDLR